MTNYVILTSSKFANYFFVVFKTTRCQSKPILCRNHFHFLQKLFRSISGEAKDENPYALVLGWPTYEGPRVQGYQKKPPQIKLAQPKYQNPIDMMVPVIPIIPEHSNPCREKCIPRKSHDSSHWRKYLLFQPNVLQNGENRYQNSTYKIKLSMSIDTNMLYYPSLETIRLSSADLCKSSSMYGLIF